MTSIQTEKAFAKVLQLLSPKFAETYQAGDVIFSEGEIGKKIFFVLDGVVNIFIQQNQLKRSLCSLSTGEVFGEMAILNNLPRTASIEAETDAKLIVLEREMFFALMEKYPVLALKMVRLMAERMHIMDVQFKQELGYHQYQSI